MKARRVLMIISILLMAAMGFDISAAAAVSPGTKGAQVKDMQEKLAALGYLQTAPDGSYGGNTKDAVKRFEKANKLTADGVADDKMLETLSKVFSAAPRITVTSSNTNVRSGAGTGYAKLGTVKKGDIFVVRSSTKVSGEIWHNFTYENKSGWIKGSLVKYSKSLSDEVNAKGKKVSVNASAVNARSYAGSENKKVATLAKGYTFTVTGSVKSGGVVWYSLSYNGKSAWVSSEYVKPEGAKTTTTKKDTSATVPAVSGKGLSCKYGEVVNVSSMLKVRSGAGESYSSKGMLPNGARVVITDTKNGWHKIKFGSSSGWVSAKHINILKKTAAAKYDSDANIAKAAKKILNGMTLDEKIGQLLCLCCDGNEKSSKALISKLKPGALLLTEKEFSDLTAKQVKSRINGYQSGVRLKMLVCAREEGGSVVAAGGSKLLRSTSYESPRKLYSEGGYKAIADDAEDKCSFLKSLGVNVNIGPVADVATKKSAAMYNRSFGMSASAVSKFVSTAVSTMKACRMGSVMVHFPGYGEGKADAKNTKSLASLKNTDLLPFKSGVASGADGIMVAPVKIESVDKTNPATVSSKCTALIRDYLGFDGVIMADARVTADVKKACGGKNACVMAIKSGCDMLYCPADPTEAVKTIKAALKNGTLTEKRINESVLRILTWKIRLGLCG